MATDAVLAGEQGTSDDVLKHAASLLPMPVYGLDLNIACGSMPEVHDVVSHLVDKMLTMQPSGPYVILGSGVLSCVLATAMACELDHQLQRQVVLVLLDGPPTLPISTLLPDPAIYGLYQIARDKGMLPVGCSNPYEPQAFAEFAAAVSEQLQQAMEASSADDELYACQQYLARSTSSSSGNMVLTTVENHCVPALEEALLDLAASAYGIQGDTLALVKGMLQFCHLARQISMAESAEFVYQGPAVMVLTDDMEGQAFLEAGKESCGGELSLVPLTGLLHGQVLNGEQQLQMVLVAVVDGLMEMLQLL